MKITPYRLRKWSVEVRWRDRKCRICDTRKKLEAHHINSKRYHPEQALDLDNGVSICKRCHLLLHNLFHTGTRKKTTRADYERFIKLSRSLITIGRMKQNKKYERR